MRLGLLKQGIMALTRQSREGKRPLRLASTKTTLPQGSSSLLPTPVHPPDSSGRHSP